MIHPHTQIYGKMHMLLAAVLLGLGFAATSLLARNALAATVVDGGTSPYAWYRADVGVVTDSADPTKAIAWNDQSGNNRTLTTHGDGPLVTTDGVGGRQVISFDGLDDYFVSTVDVWGSAAPGTVFAVWKRTGGFGVGAHARYVYDAAGDGSDAATGDRQFFSIAEDGTIKTGGAVYTTTFETHYTGNGEVLDTIGADTWAVTSVSDVTGTSDTVWINDETVYTGDLLSGGMDGIKIGCYMRDYDKLALEGYIAEIIVFEGELSNSERLAITQELIDRWGLIFKPGDANKDGFVNELDAAVLAENWLVQENATWDMGDFNGDYKVDDIDAALLASNWGSANVAQVPEPGMLVLVIGGLAALILSTKYSR